MDLSLSFGLWWVAACCSDVTNFIIMALVRQGVQALSYINNFGRVAMDKAMVTRHFNLMHATLKQLGMQEASHKTCPPA